jgi:two-component system, cell cycle sensor histidine kinase and response regulator CckA
MLVSNGYAVLEAVDGLSALASVRAHSPDMILLDVRMPGMDGYEVCRRLKAEEHSRHIPVIFVSALDDQTDKVQGFASGGVDYITKPFQIKEVLARVETHLTLRNLQFQLEDQNARLQREIAERLRVENALQQVNVDLEQRVLERTAELLSVNRSLNIELQERRRAEQALLESQAEKERLLSQVREIVNTVPEGMLLLDSSGEIIMANLVAQQNLTDLASAHLGDVLERLGDRPLASLLTPPPPGLWHEVKAGEYTYEVIARPMVEPPAAQRWVLVIRDVTSEREIQRRDQQQERLAAVGQLAAGISHDFNNILAVIQLYTEMMLGWQGLEPRMRERLQTISEQSRRAADLIQQILDFSRRAVLERRPMDLLPFLKEQVKLLQRTLPENIRLSFNYQPGEYLINADPTRMQQAIMNLALNARDAMPQGGNLSFFLERASLSTDDICIECGRPMNGEWVKISVIDSGSGIPAEVMSHIFEPFYTTKPVGQGTGLGLAQVFGIVSQHEGHISLSSTLNTGTTFFLFLPALRTPKLVSPDRDSSVIANGRGQTILLVEDEPVTRQALVEGLTLLNYTVIPASDGQQALYSLNERRGLVDLVLSDVVMPELGGIPLMHAIRNQRLDIPIILMTGHPMQEELEKLQDNGLTAWILKPPRLRELARIIAQALE